jgi:RNA polymerase sigma factor (sigma-70 family)
LRSIMVSTQTLDDWFVNEVLPHEAMLTQFLRRHWRNDTEIIDLRQEVYIRLYESARNVLPDHTAAFVFSVARNLIIDQVRRARIVSIDLVGDLESLTPVDHITPDRIVIARDELRLLQEGLEQLPARCREVVMLRKLENLSQRDVAQRMEISEDTVERQTTYGLRALADFMLGGTGRIVRNSGAKYRRPKNNVL